MARCQPIPTSGRGRVKDLTGHRYGHLFIVGFAGVRKESLWFAICRCGKSCVSTQAPLRRGDKVSCGCKQGLTRKELIHTRIVVDPVTQCWNWMHSRSSRNGYGQLRFENKKHLAHRFSYETFVGPIPEGFHALHKCDNPQCVAPHHLFLGSKADNSLDCSLKGRQDSKLKADDIPEIRRLLAAGMNRVAIGRQFNVDGNTIMAIERGQTWKHVV